MNLHSRIRSLERRRSGKNCPICGGQGRLVVTCNSSYGPPSNPPLIGCANCGEILHIKIVEMTEEAVWTRHREKWERRAMLSLRTRLRRLEAVTQPASVLCSVCGHHPNVTARLRLAKEDEEVLGPDSCPSCGWIRVIRLTFDASD